MTDVPRRAYRLVLDLEADSYEGLLNELDNIGIQLSVEPRREGCSITTGGAAASWHCEITHENKTADGYRRELTAWCDQRRAERAARQGESA